MVLLTTRLQVVSIFRDSGVNVSALKSIALGGMNEEENAIHEDVSIDKFTVIIRMLSLALHHTEPTSQNHHATAINHTLAPPFFSSVDAR